MILSIFSAMLPQNLRLKFEASSFYSKIRSCNLIELSFLFLFIIYALFFYLELKPFWFNPNITTDDAYQQIYQFYQVLDPSLFQNDLITDFLKGYLAPVHYGLGYMIVKLCGDPIMMGHWMMFVQIFLTLIFIFAGVKHLASTPVAFFSMLWFLHTRHVIQRMTGGLPRGWAAPLIAAFLCFVVRGNHWGVLITLLLGCLTNPPTTFLIATAYGLFLFIGVIDRKTRSVFKRPFLIFLLSSPLFIICVLLVVKRPESVGQMVGLEQALQMPEFDRLGGRFPFLPLLPAWDEIRSFGFQAFIMPRVYNSGQFLKLVTPYLVLSSLLVFFIVGWRKNKQLIPRELSAYFFSIIIVYFASRFLAFKLYVPDRHIQIPLAMFFIFTFPVALWRLFYIGDKYKISELKYAWKSALALVALCAFIFIASGSGLKGGPNFNVDRATNNSLWSWINQNTDKTAVFAGHPILLDGLPLFTQRRIYAGTEAAHPFYLGYFNEIKRRLTLTWQAYYAQDINKISQILLPESVDYFVFKNSDFLQESLQKAEYFKPLHILVAELTRKPKEIYAFSKLPLSLDPVKYPYLVYRDERFVVIDLRKVF